jgi:1,5-anhydro-D-fructose reductase (1,5-anhydro-D-mannitol-forming)
MIRYGILGFGHHGEKRLAPAFLDAERSVLSGIWRRDEARARENARAFEIPHVFETPEELCSSGEVDAVFVASPDALHSPHTLLALRHGKPVLCEKPLAMNAAEAEEMAAAAERAGLKFGVAQNFRWNRSLRRMREMLGEGRVGRPVLAAANFCFLSERSPRAWISDAGMACGGPIGDVGVHCVDALRFLLSDDVVAVSALARSDAQPGGMEDTAALLLEFSGGALGSVQVSFRAQYRTSVEVTGSTGLLAAENGLTVDAPVEVVVRDGGKVVSTEEVSNADAYSRMLDAFAAAIEDGAAFAASGRDAINNQRTLDAAFASWRSGKREAVAG